MLHTKDYKHFRVGNVEFEGATAAAKALPGDQVRVENGRVVEIVERASHKHIVGTLELASKYRYGMTTKNHPIYLFTPFTESYPPFYVGSAHKDTSQNVLAIIDFAYWTEACPRGNLQQILGIAGDLSMEEEALAIQASPLRWKKLEALVSPPPIETWAKGITFHVDPPGCKDIDDAITLNPLGEKTEISIHIADVASWLVANPWLMTKAEDIGQTLYRDGVAIRPMFPIEFSEGIFSLLLGEDRRAVTLRCLWNKTEKKLENITWSLEMIRVTQSFTYHSVRKSMFALELEEICSGIANRPVTDSHEWIEQLMLLYNREAAKVLREKGAGVLRRHAGLDQARYDTYQRLGLPAEKLAMAAGEYCAATDDTTRHWGLGQDVYCHASSPIRRWSDCVNQRILLGHTAIANIEHMNARAKAFKAYERDMIFVRALLRCNTTLIGTITEPGRVWIPSWGRIVKSDTSGFEPGSGVVITYFCDATKRNWKRRLVLKLEAVEHMSSC
ncbi:MAG: RNB domain-containing ribonuclease [Bacteroidetes bacterium]|nr:RNB domain-containing ribonuclease [bacterium]NBP66008.1 RNB domain-containing ribonuclease [Bacteroidota bacterium]